MVLPASIILAVLTLLGGLWIQRRWERFGRVVLTIAVGILAWHFAVVPVVWPSESVYGQSRWRVLGGAIMLGAAVALWFAVRRRALASPVCRRCGHDVRGVREPRCPECGTPFASRGLRTHARRGPALLACVGLLALAGGVVRVPSTLAWGPIGLVPDWFMTIAWPWMPVDWIWCTTGELPTHQQDRGTMAWRLWSGEWDGLPLWRHSLTGAMLHMPIASWRKARLFVHLKHGQRDHQNGRIGWTMPPRMVDEVLQALVDGTDDPMFVRLGRDVRDHWYHDPDEPPSPPQLARLRGWEAMLHAAARHDTEAGRVALNLLSDLRVHVSGETAIEMARWYVYGGGPFSYGGSPIVDERIDDSAVQEFLRIAMDESEAIEGLGGDTARSRALGCLVSLASVDGISVQRREIVRELSLRRLRAGVGLERTRAYDHLLRLDQRSLAHESLVDAIVTASPSDDDAVIRAVLYGLLDRRHDRKSDLLAAVAPRTDELRRRSNAPDAPASAIAAATLLVALSVESGTRCEASCAALRTQLDAAQGRFDEWIVGVLEGVCADDPATGTFARPPHPVTLRALIGR